jgi:hypothetical protein
MSSRTFFKKKKPDRKTSDVKSTSSSNVQYDCRLPDCLELAYKVSNMQQLDFQAEGKGKPKIIATYKDYALVGMAISGGLHCRTEASLRTIQLRLKVLSSLHGVGVADTIQDLASLPNLKMRFIFRKCEFLLRNPGFMFKRSRVWCSSRTRLIAIKLMT